MGLFDTLAGAAAQAAREALQAQGAPAGAATGSAGVGGFDPQLLVGLVSTLLNQVGGISGLMAKLQAAGLGDAVQSWVGTGANQAVPPEGLGAALGPDLMGTLARQLGGNGQDVAGVLASLLPTVVDQLTPQGQVPADNGMGALGALLGGGGGAAGPLMGALGALLGKR